MIDAAVVDASVGIKLFVDEEGSLAADKLFSGLASASPAQFYVPDLFYIECANILWKYVHRYGFPAENALRDAADLQALDLIIASTSELLLLALELALSSGITAYDACYAALAMQLGIPLITADKALMQKLAGTAVEIRLLSEI